MAKLIEIKPNGQTDVVRTADVDTLIELKRQLESEKPKYKYIIK